jgi:hypothetical protein
MNTIYSDGLIEITDQYVVFRRYYLPFGGDKYVPLSQIEMVQTRPPSIWFGSWRIWGGSPWTWFPLDGARPNRDTIFVAFLRSQFIRIGFTVENSKKVTEILKKLGLMR